MKFPVLASVLVFIIILTISIKKSDKKIKNQMENFWERERLANSIRKKPLDDLEYINIPSHFLTLPIAPEDDRAVDALSMLKHLSDKKIVNLTGISNTDLKLTYGTANITALSEYDQNYTLLARSLQQIAVSLVDNSHPAEAKEVLEFAIDTKTDISATYTLLAHLYSEEGHPEKIDELIGKAHELNGLTAPSIARHLEAAREAVDVINSQKK